MKKPRGFTFVPLCFILLSLFNSPSSAQFDGDAIPQLRYSLPNFVMPPPTFSPPSTYGVVGPAPKVVLRDGSGRTISLAEFDRIMGPIKAYAGSFQGQLNAYYQDRLSGEPQRRKELGIYMKGKQEEFQAEALWAITDSAALIDYVAPMIHLTVIGSDIIITPLGVFESCNAAREFRDTVAVSSADEQKRRIHAGVQDRMNAILPELDQHRNFAQTLYKNASYEQRKELLMTLTMYLLRRRLGDVLHYVLENSSVFQLDKTASVVLEALADRALGITELGSKTYLYGKVDALDVAGLNIDTLSLALKESPYFQILNLAQLGTEAASVWMKWEPIRTAAKGEYGAYESAMKRIFDSSPDNMLRLIDQTRTVIDRYCGK